MGGHCHVWVAPAQRGLVMNSRRVTSQDSRVRPMPQWEIQLYPGGKGPVSLGLIVNL